jgi:hypothetical protein
MSLAIAGVISVCLFNLYRRITVNREPNARFCGGVIFPWKSPCPETFRSSRAAAAAKPASVRERNILIY